MPPTPPRDVVLLLTHSGDFYNIDLISHALARRGVRPIRFNTDLFPSSVKLSARAGDERAAELFTEAGEQISAAEVRAVWARKLCSPRMSDDLDERYRSMCIGESMRIKKTFKRGRRKISSFNYKWPANAAPLIHSFNFLAKRFSYPCHNLQKAGGVEHHA